MPETQPPPDEDEILTFKLDLPRWLIAAMNLQARLARKQGYRVTQWAEDALIEACDEALKKIAERKKRQGQDDIPPTV